MEFVGRLAWMCELSKLASSAYGFVSCVAHEAPDAYYFPITLPQLPFRNIYATCAQALLFLIHRKLLSQTATAAPGNKCEGTPHARCRHATANYVVTAKFKNADGRITVRLIQSPAGQWQFLLFNVDSPFFLQ
jgi:hypothetical protein